MSRGRGLALGRCSPRVSVAHQTERDERASPSHDSFLVAFALRSLYKGIYPLWGRQIPYTMMKFGEWVEGEVR